MMHSPINIRFTMCRVYHPFDFQSHCFQPKCMNNVHLGCLQNNETATISSSYVQATRWDFKVCKKTWVYNRACEKHKVVNLKVSGIRLLIVDLLGDVGELRCQKLSDTPKGRVKNLILWITTPCSFLQSVSCMEFSTSNPKYIKSEYKLWSLCWHGRNGQQVSTKQSKHQCTYHFWSMWHSTLQETSCCYRTLRFIMVTIKFYRSLHKK